jgi:hypothetical protein
MITKTRRLMQKFIVLAMLLASLGLMSVGDARKAKACSPNSALPCCSYCDEHPDAPICDHGCSFGCRDNH